MCKHKNFSIVEIYHESGTWTIEDGVMPEESYFHTEDMHDTIDVKCFDCGFSKTYKRYRKLPKWLKPYVDAIDHGGGSDIQGIR
jgi:hypothetical protein